MARRRTGRTVRTKVSPRTKAVTRRGIYGQLRKASRAVGGWPTHYRTDFTYHDRALIARYRPVAVVWGVRETGTDMWMLIHRGVPRTRSEARQAPKCAQIPLTSHQTPMKKWAVDWLRAKVESKGGTVYHFFYVTPKTKKKITPGSALKIVEGWVKKGWPVVATA